MVSKKAVLLLVISIGLPLVFGMSGFAAQQTQRVVSSSGTVTTVGIGVYWDVACTNATTSMPWGNVEPGASLTRTVYLKNSGNVPLVLNMTTSNWVPTAASTYITLSWDRQGVSIPALTVINAVVTLRVSSSVTGIQSFSFDITFEGKS